MGKRMRRKVTVTITYAETWTIVWSSVDDPLHPLSRMVQTNSETVDELGETLPPSLPCAEAADSTIDNPTATPLMPTVIDPQSSDTPNLSIDSKRKRVQVRRTKTNLQR
jgi:hypothetical protein